MDSLYGLMLYATLQTDGTACILETCNYSATLRTAVTNCRSASKRKSIVCSENVETYT